MRECVRARFGPRARYFGRARFARALGGRAAGMRGRGYGAPRGRNEAQLLVLAVMLWRQVEQLPYKPPVTLGMIALQAYVYLQSPLSPEQACLAPLREAVRVTDEERDAV